MPVRGCGTREQGGVYFCLEPGPDGLPIEHFLFCSPWTPPPDVKLTARGVQWWKDAQGTWHLLDICGSEHYPNVADWIEESRRFGVSRRIRKNLEFDRLTRASRLILLHARANILNWRDFLAHDLEMAWDCPRRVPTHRLHKRWSEHQTITSMEAQEEMCSGFWWHDVEGGETTEDPFDKRIVTRAMPSFSYHAWEPPREPVFAGEPPGPPIKRIYTLAGVGAFPATRLVVIRAQDGSHGSTTRQIKETGCTLRVEEEDE
jgi:hypothetical protein